MASTVFESPVVRTYRELLRVERDASPDAVRKAYRAMAMVYHPDQNPDGAASAVFLRIKEAYDVLRDPEAIQRLNEDYFSGKSREPCVKGLALHLGSFFGHRFSRTGRRHSSDREDFPWWEAPPVLNIDARGNPFYTTDIESNISIMDHPSLDLVEVIFAGRFDVSDEFALYEAFRRKDFGALPWFVLNNEGVVHFLNRNYASALACYEELNARIPDNVVFLFRLGLCHEVMAFKNLRFSLLRGTGPDRRHVRAAIRCFERAITLGELRPHLPQKCMTIRKTLGDLLELTGSRWQAYRAWQLVRDVDPESREAQERMRRVKPAAAGMLEGR
jgi:hypothetical protein